MRHLIDGVWRDPSGDRASALVDPATEETIGAVVAATSDEIDAAVRAAQRAFAASREAPSARRRATLAALICAVERRRGAFALTISAEMGAPVDFAARHQVETAIGHLRAILRAAEEHPDDAPVAPHGPEHRVRHEPLGVAALITPWNWPLNQVALKAGAALAAGCGMVLKPSELAPRTGILFADAMAEALSAQSAPPGLFNLVLGDGETGAALTRHAAIDAVSFTGSTRAGRAVAQAAAADLKRVTLELGGKSPNLLFEDCDLALAVKQGVAHCFRNAGQSCNAASRMLVARSIYDEAVTRAAAAARDTLVAPPDQHGSHLGPQVSRAQYERVQGCIQQGLSEGARLAAGGLGRPQGLERGFYSRPTVFAEVTPAMALFREEIFGPVLSITPFETEEEAIRLANDTEYGLAGFIQTRDPARADRVARRLRVGMVQVNGRSRAPGAPFGGVKGSGFGREAGIWGIRAFQDVKSISGAAADAGDDETAW